MSESHLVANMKKQIRGIALLLIWTSTVPMTAGPRAALGHGDADAGEAWSELGQSMEKMHVGMGSIEPSGESDTDFVKLMLPHHQGAIDMAKTELMHGKDSQMRRLAQEIITDQQSEIALMQLWLKQHKSSSQAKHQAPASPPRRES
jgi:uncharacterized protein (DUF305 family)